MFNILLLKAAAVCMALSLLAMCFGFLIELITDGRCKWFSLDKTAMLMVIFAAIGIAFYILATVFGDWGG